MDNLVIGCGLCGAVIARELAEKGEKVTIWERRNHIGGNMYDYIDEHGILVQKYGPHIFHTKKKEIYQYICKYEKWNSYQLTCGTVMDDMYCSMPFNFGTIDKFYDEESAKVLKNKLNNAYEGCTATVVQILNSEDKMIREYGELLFEKDYGPYTAKQWGISPSQVDQSILKRVPVRLDYIDRYFDDEYEVMPNSNFTTFFTNLLNHENIEVHLNVDALEHMKILENKIYLDGQEFHQPVFYTGVLDELFENSEGKLPYRSLRFEWEHKDAESIQGAPVVAYPQAEGYTRITEYKKLPIQNVSGTTYAIEYPLHYNADENQEPYYPLLTEESQKNYAIYREKTERINNLYCCGRLADYKYYNMDQALESALILVESKYNGK